MGFPLCISTYRFLTKSYSHPTVEFVVIPLSSSLAMRLASRSTWYVLTERLEGTIHETPFLFPRRNNSGTPAPSGSSPERRRVRLRNLNASRSADVVRND